MSVLRSLLRVILPRNGSACPRALCEVPHCSWLVMGRQCQSTVGKPEAMVLDCEKLPSSSSLPLDGPVEVKEEAELDLASPRVDALSTDLDLDFLNSLRSQHTVAFNLATFVNRSATLCKLVDLGMDLSWVEMNFPQLKRHLLKLNFEKDVVPLLKFLHELKLDRSQIVSLLTRNPFLLADNLHNLQTRVSYLKSKHFTDNNIQRIITVAHNFLSFPTKDIDSRLGFLQQTFHLTGNEVRKSTVQCPKVPLCDQKFIRSNKHLLEDEMSLTADQIKELYMGSPTIYTLSRNELLNRFEQFTRDLGVSANLVVRQPAVLLWRPQRVSQRHQYLAQIGRAQYDPTQPCYVSLTALATLRDPEFCQNVARTSLEDYHKFLKTL